jgi:1-acyl-sn-glycerol-3-phosphate acyltransferase
MTGVRSLLFSIWFFGLTTLLALTSAPMPLFGARVAVRYAQSWVRLILWGLRAICGIRYEVTGLEHLPPSGPALIASMHQSAFDTLVWSLLAPRFTYILKRELMRIPLFGMMLRLTGMIAVDRAAGAAAMRGMLRDAERAVAEQRQIVIFPEGTRVAPGVRVKLQPGVAALAARTGLPVIPVATDSGFYWGRRAFHKHPGVIRIAILPPIEPGLPRQALMRRLEATFAAGAAALRTPVDKSVGGTLGGFPSRAS